MQVSFERLRIQCLSDRILKCISLPEFIIIMFRFISLLKIEVVISEKVIVILWADYFHRQFLLYVFVRIII